MKIYCINLESEFNRRNYIKIKSKEYNLNVSFINAVLGKSLDSNLLTSFHSDSESVINRRLTDGEVGCYLSHINTLKEFLSTDDDYAIVIEDDIEITENLMFFINEFKDSKEPNNFDIILLGYRNGYGSLWGATSFLGRDIIRFSDCGYGAHAYLITRYGAEKILNEATIPQWPFDYVTGGAVIPTLRVYGLKYKIVELNSVLSQQSSLEGGRNFLGSYSTSYVNKGLFSYVRKLLKMLKPIKSYKK